MDIQQKYSASLTYPVAELTLRNRKNGFSRFIFISGIFLLLLVSGCAFKSGLKEKIVQLPESNAKPPATTGILAHLSNDITARYGDEYSGFRILDKSLDGLKWRLALIDSAVSSIDVLTYLWYPDHSGRILLDRVIQASQRGVKVRLVVDDLLLEGLDQTIANLENQPNIEFRIFNPWKNRVDMGSRAGELIAEMERLNNRMHDKLLIVDGHAAVVGGRNIGDHYLGLSNTFNFHDIDLLGIGHIGLQANEMFDSFWNSTMLVSAQNLTVKPDKALARAQLEKMQQKIASAPELAAFPRKPKDWNDELTTQAKDLRIGKSKMVYDEVSSGQIDQTLGSKMFNFFNMAENELMIINAYVIPSQRGIDIMQALHDKGVKVRILTNSLASHDVPAVNSHYAPWRDEIIKAGVDLYELRSDPEIRSIVDVPPAKSEFIGLHAKSSVVDRRYVFIGSMNLDPRSYNINTEMGVFVDSPELAEDLVKIILRDTRGENAWHVLLDPSFITPY